MSTDTSRSPSAVEVARRLLASSAAPPGETDPEMVAAGLQRTIARVAQSLRDSMGADGCNALLARAIARAEVNHPVLKDYGRFSDGQFRMDGMATMIKAHDVVTVTAAIEGVLAALVDVLGRLIGEEMAIRLIDHGALWPRQGDGAELP